MHVRHCTWYSAANYFYMFLCALHSSSPLLGPSPHTEDKWS